MDDPKQSGQENIEKTHYTEEIKSSLRHQKLYEEGLERKKNR